MKRYYSHLEDYTLKMYESINIVEPKQLDMYEIASKIGLTLMLLPVNSLYIDNVIVIDSRKSKEQQWQDFGHELCHALLHVGNQNLMPLPFRLYQEWKAEIFAYHACIPTFMLDNLAINSCTQETIMLVQELFKVEYEFALTRLTKYIQNKWIIQNMNRKQLQPLRD